MAKSKYNVAPKSERTLGGVTYMSKLEKSYRQRLNMLTKAKDLGDRVVDIKEQVPFSIDINGKHICKYLLDFQVTYGDMRVEYVDVKGVRTSVYSIKKKLVEAVHKIKIKEVTKKDF